MDYDTKINVFCERLNAQNFETTDKIIFSMWREALNCACLDLGPSGGNLNSIKRRESVDNTAQTPNVYIMCCALWDMTKLIFDSRADSHTQRAL